MSFSSNVKEELTREVVKARHCQIAEIAGIFQNIGKIAVNDDTVELTITTENVVLAKRYFELTKKAFRVSPELIVTTSEKLKKNRVYKVYIKEKKSDAAMYGALKWQVKEKEQKIDEPVDKLIIMQSCCKRAYLRGVFLAVGSVTDPGKGYHLEIVVTNENKAKQITDEFLHFGIEVRTVERKGHIVCYIKEGEKISDALNVIGAHSALMELENVRIIKEVRNDVNRRVNCETANINKTVNAAVRQVEDIEYIDKVMGLKSLSPQLKEAAEKRLMYPEATLKELAALLNPPCGKSGLNHRLMKISAMAKELRGE